MGSFLSGQGPLTSYPAGFASGVAINNIPLAISSSRGQVFWVDNSTSTQKTDFSVGSDGNIGTFNAPFATLQTAINACLDNNGDIIFVGPNHAETISAAAGMVSNKIGVTVIGVGNGNNRPTFTFATSTAATWTVTAANNAITGILATNTVDQLVSPFVVSATGCYLDLEWRDLDSTHEALRAILTTAAADNLQVNLKYVGATGGTHNVNAIRLVGCDNGRINVDFYGKASTAVVEFVTTACKNVDITGMFYVSGTTDLSKNVVDTVTGSTWGVQGFDVAAGLSFDGGSGKAIGGTDVTAVIANQAVPTADSTANTLSRDAVGNKTDASVYTPGTTKSLIAYVKGGADLQEGVAISSTAVLATGTTIFTIAGGPIEIISLVSECVTTNDATAATLQYRSAPTVGVAATFSGASASLANVAAGGSVVLQGTALSTAPVINASGPGIQATGATAIYVPAGTITTTVGSGPSTGTWRHLIRYRPLAKGVTVS